MVDPLWGWSGENITAQGHDLRLSLNIMVNYDGQIADGFESDERTSICNDQQDGNDTLRSVPLLSLNDLAHRRDAGYRLPLMHTRLTQHGTPCSLDTMGYLDPFYKSASSSLTPRMLESARSSRIP